MALSLSNSMSTTSLPSFSELLQSLREHGDVPVPAAQPIRQRGGLPPALKATSNKSSITNATSKSPLSHCGRIARYQPYSPDAIRKHSPPNKIEALREPQAITAQDIKSRQPAIAVSVSRPGTASTPRQQPSRPQPLSLISAKAPQPLTQGPSNKPRASSQAGKYTIVPPTPPSPFVIPTLPTFTPTPSGPARISTHSVPAPSKVSQAQAQAIPRSQRPHPRQNQQRPSPSHSAPTPVSLSLPLNQTRNVRSAAHSRDSSAGSVSSVQSDRSVIVVSDDELEACGVVTGWTPARIPMLQKPRWSAEGYRYPIVLSRSR